MEILKHPFSKKYWKQSTGHFSNLSTICFLSILMSLGIILSSDLFSIYIIPNAVKISFGFIITVLIAFIYGPIVSILAGVIIDILSFFLAHSSYPFFFGYTLSAMLSGLIFSLFLFRSNITVLRLLFSKLFVNIFVNALLGSLWMEMMTKNSGLVKFWTRLFKNIICLPFELIILYIILKSFIPILKNISFIPEEIKIGL